MFLSLSRSLSPPHPAFIGVVGIVTRLWALYNEGLLLHRGRRFPCSLKHTDGLWVPPIPLVIVYQKSFIQG